MRLTFPNLSKYETKFMEALGYIDREQVPKRIWQKDYTLWSSQPEEITNRLGWLDMMDSMYLRVPELETFGDEIRQEGISDIVLLGMGGSSLGANVLDQVLGAKEGYPQLTVLDSTIPETVNSVRESIKLEQTLFLVSSKSGTTAETGALFDCFYYYGLQHSGSRAGRHFLAITDPGSPLEVKARERGFRRVFGNATDIGGRYSVLSYFGLVPAAMLGIDITDLLSAADAARRQCSPDIKTEQNEGCLLGAFFASMSKQHKDKVTIVTSPMLKSFGLWVEQLIAESTGKNGKGLVPVVGEPLVETNMYGSDRQFVYLRLAGDDNPATDSFINRIKSAGHPLAVIELANKLELGSVFYLWEFAIAVAGMLIGIQPFDEPDVQRTKDATKRLLKQYTDSGKLPPATEAGKSLAELISRAIKGDYFAVMAYIRKTQKTDHVFQELRRKLLENYKLATTLGYGPGFLHSTGQLHKGGPNTGLFIQVVSNNYQDIPVPGKPYSFGIMSEAQSLGDLQALQSLNRRVIRIALDPAPISEFPKKIEIVRS